MHDVRRPYVESIHPSSKPLFKPPSFLFTFVLCQICSNFLTITTGSADLIFHFSLSRFWNMCSCCCKTLLGARRPGFCLPNVPGLNGFVQPAIVTRSQGYRATIPRSNCLLIAKIFRKLRIFWSERPFLSGSVRLVYLVYEASGGG